MAWIPVLLILLTGIFVDSLARGRTSDRVMNARAYEAVPPALDPDSPTGYAFGQHRRLLPSSVDGYHWLLQTEEILSGHQFRVRFVRFDNAPSGREAHWSSGLPWWLAGLAGIDHLFTGRALPLALERVAPFALPLLLAILLVGLVPVLAARFGILVAGVIGAGLVFNRPLADAFAAGTLDHHGIVSVLGLLTVLGLVAGGGGWQRDPATLPDAHRPDAGDPLFAWLPDRSRARRWFTASAVAGAAGLWVSSATQVPVLLGIGLGAAINLLGARPGGPSAHPWRMDPTLWRWWGIVGAATSLGFYLLESIPGHCSLRLEVNHPLYALAWLGAGDLLCRLGIFFNGDRRQNMGRALVAALPGLLALLALPLVILLARDRVFVLADPFLWALHVDYIQEFQPYLANLAANSWQTVLVTACHPLLGLLLATALLAFRGIERPWKSLLVLVLAPLTVSITLFLLQERWLVPASALSLAAIATSLLVVLKSPAFRKRRGLSAAFAGILGLGMIIHPLWWGVYWLQSHSGATADASNDLTTRTLAHSLRQRLGAERGVIVGGFVTTSGMIYFGGFQGLGTAYWENRDGLRAAVEILGAESDADALAGIEKHGVTHIVDASWDFFSTPAAQLLHGRRKNDPPTATGFLNRLEAGNFPVWVRPVLAVSGAQNAIVYEVDLRQTPRESQVANARFFADHGDLDRAEKILTPALAENPPAPAALRAQAGIQAGRNDPAGLAATLRRLASMPPQFQPDPAGRLDEARGWLTLGDEAAARRAAENALATLDERGLRRLDAPRLARLLEYADRWNLAFPSAISREFALGLLPPAMRPAAGR